MAQLDVTWLSALMVLVVCYYVMLFVIASIKRRARQTDSTGLDQENKPPARPEMQVVLVIPAHNEAAVIRSTLANLSAVGDGRFTILVMDDGSVDGTGAIAAECCQRVVVVRREPPNSGQGKGAVLNHALRVITDWVDKPGSPLWGLRPDRILVGVMDADGQLDRDALRHVTPVFDDPLVGGVQIGVRIANADANWLTLMQDIEFVGFSGLVQEARNSFGSVGLGGNGQFARLSALLSLESEPWTACLSEDLDLGLTLLERGWLIRFCPTTYVAQQGLTRVRPLLRQRTRWVQGHLQCWRHLPTLATSRGISLASRLDVAIYLTFITFVLVLGVGLVLSALQLAGLVELVDTAYDPIPDGPLRRAVILVVSFAPAVMFMSVYQRNARRPLRPYEVPWFLAVFSVYCYHWLYCLFWAWWRMLRGRRAWAKTPRLAMPSLDHGPTTRPSASAL